MSDLAQRVQELNLRFLLISFTDLFGIQRAKLVPASAVAAMARDGAGFAGFAAWLDLSPADGDVMAIPAAASLTPLPWQPEVGWVAAELQLNGQPMAQCPRRLLRHQLERAAERGLELRSGVEAEFFLLDPTGAQIADRADTQEKPCYDQLALMRRYPLIAPLLEAMEQLGWGPYQADHEDANGQFEVNWTYAEALTTADRHAFFKVMVKSLAEQQGLRASFMPKPFAALTGNGCHTHLSLWGAAGRANAGQNLFHDPAGALGLSELAYQFLGGLLAHAPALSCLTNPTVNSYRRLAAPPTSSGATWSPGGISYSGNNRTHMVRIPDDQRLELRLPDGAAHPYLLQAAILAAGLDGIERQLHPGPRHDNDNYAAPLSADACGRLPNSLGEALDAFAADTALRQALGENFCVAYERLRRRQWNEHRSEVTPWERRTGLDG
ncbi:type III glutamate--ammonia ligase [Cyanobium sp. FACHB-13342]|uniref:type III glutamate--ammonia ligase n=1 Tax=Cyanobium sp. FACHB-13342 TaxID=2692793 RepID=UPI001681A4ED|nr:type III glutamate--ammonia ligase [Cyanobium sp. FACHB-13342]MBD2423000.1 type III glutamate--ammonia ligase [Cyanobium sp. FACHB-13342]